MRKTRHDFFSDPNWPLPDPSLTLPPPRTSSPNNLKEEHQPSLTKNVPSFDQVLFDMNAQPKSLNSSIEKLEAESEEEQAKVIDYDEMAEKARELIESVLMEDEPKGILKIEEPSF